MCIWMPDARREIRKHGSINRVAAWNDRLEQMVAAGLGEIGLGIARFVWWLHPAAPEQPQRVTWSFEISLAAVPGVGRVPGCHTDRECWTWSLP